jgi:hypothetical protein
MQRRTPEAAARVRAGPRAASARYPGPAPAGQWPPGYGLRKLVTETVLNFVTHDMGTYAAAHAFGTAIALFPFPSFLLGLPGAAGRPDFFDWLLEQGRLTSPRDAFGSVERRSVKSAVAIRVGCARSESAWRCGRRPPGSAP